MTRVHLAALGLLACAPRQPVVLSSAYAFQPVLGDVAAAYFTVENRSAVADTLTGVEVSGATIAMLHEQVESDGRGEMRHLGALPLPPHSTLVLRPGGIHLMIEGFARAPVVGDTLDIRVRFAHAGEVAVRAPVRAYGSEP